jgi:hypothetical protein
MYKFSNYNNSHKEKFIKYSYLRNGFLKNFIRKRNERKNKKSLGLDRKEIFDLLFMSLFLTRTLISITISDDNYTALMYIGRSWHLLGANFMQNEVLCILWTLNFICVYVFVINSQTKQYKWLEVYEFLNGFLPYEEIGKY